jgi:hypothetical protein
MVWRKTPCRVNLVAPTAQGNDLCVPFQVVQGSDMYVPNFLFFFFFLVAREQYRTKVENL